MFLVEASASVFGIAILLGLYDERIVPSFALLVAPVLFVIGGMTAEIVGAVTPGERVGVVGAVGSLASVIVAGRLLYKCRFLEAARQFEAGVRLLFVRFEWPQIASRQRPNRQREAMA
jgi:hypothetical protein